METRVFLRASVRSQRRRSQPQHYRRPARPLPTTSRQPLHARGTTGQPPKALKAATTRAAAATATTTTVTISETTLRTPLSRRQPRRR